MLHKCGEGKPDTWKVRYYITLFPVSVDQARRDEREYQESRPGGETSHSVPASGDILHETLPQVTFYMACLLQDVQFHSNQ